MKQIKTIIEKTIDEFDRAVNNAIAEGWVLIKRDFILGESKNCALLYAELERAAKAKESVTIGEFKITPGENMSIMFTKLDKEYNPDKRCDNCKHHANDVDEMPCAICDPYFDKWEDAE